MKKIVLLKFDLQEDVDNNVYYVEAKPDKRWINVGGPFNTRNQAINFARDYSVNYHVPTRVVVKL